MTPSTLTRKMGTFKIPFVITAPSMQDTSGITAIILSSDLHHTHKYTSSMLSLQPLTHSPPPPLPLSPNSPVHGVSFNV